MLAQFRASFLFHSILRILISPPLCAAFSLAHHSLFFTLLLYCFAVFLSYFLSYYTSSFYSRCLSFYVLAQSCRSVLVCCVPYTTREISMMDRPLHISIKLPSCPLHLTSIHFPQSSSHSII